MDRVGVVGRLARQYARLEEPDGGGAALDATARPQVKKPARTFPVPTKGPATPGLVAPRQVAFPKPQLKTVGCPSLAKSAPAATAAAASAAASRTKVLQAVQALEVGRPRVASAPPGVAHLRRGAALAPPAAPPMTRSSSSASSAALAERRAAYQAAAAAARKPSPRFDGAAIFAHGSKESIEFPVESVVEQPDGFELGMDPTPKASAGGADDLEDIVLYSPVAEMAAEHVLTGEVGARLLPVLEPSSSLDATTTPVVLGTAMVSMAPASLAGPTPEAAQDGGNTYLSLESREFDSMAELARAFMSLSEQVSHDLHKAATAFLSGEAPHDVDPGFQYKLLAMMRRRVVDEAVAKAREKCPMAAEHEIVTVKRVKLNGDLLVGEDETEITILTDAVSKPEASQETKSAKDPLALRQQFQEILEAAPALRQQFQEILEAALFKAHLIDPESTPDSLLPTDQEKAVLRLTPRAADEEDSSDDEQEATEKAVAAAAVTIVRGAASNQGPTSIEKLVDLVQVDPAMILAVAMKMRPGSRSHRREKVPMDETLEETINKSEVSDDGTVSAGSTMLEESSSVDYSDEITREVTLDTVDYTRDGTLLADDEATFDPDETKDEFPQQASFMSASLATGATDERAPATPPNKVSLLAANQTSVTFESHHASRVDTNQDSMDSEADSSKDASFLSAQERPHEIHSHTSGSSTEVTANAGDSKLYTTFTAGHSSPVSLLPLNNSLLSGVNSTLPSVTLFDEGDTIEAPSILFHDTINMEIFSVNKPTNEGIPALAVEAGVPAEAGCKPAMTRKPVDPPEEKPLMLNEEARSTTEEPEMPESRENESPEQRKSRSSNTTSTKKSRSKEVLQHQNSTAESKPTKATAPNPMQTSKSKNKKSNRKIQARRHEDSVSAGLYIAEMMSQELMLVASDIATVYDEISKNTETSKSSCSWLRCW